MSVTVEKPASYWNSGAAEEEKLKAADELYEEWWKIVEKDRDSASVPFEALDKILYVHGGYMGVGPLFLLDKVWVKKLLRMLMPEVYMDVAQEELFESKGKPNPWHNLVKWAENNPVVAAYGTLTSRSVAANDVEEASKWTMAPLEWDVFVDPAFCRELQGKLEEEAADKTAVVDWVTRRFNEAEDIFWVAHGTVFQLAIANMGLTPQLNYSSIRRTSPIEGGGVSARRWIATFAVACECGASTLNTGDDETPKDLATFLDSATLEQSVLRLEAALAKTVQSTTCTATRNDSATKKPCSLSLFFDIKSRWIPTALWGPIVQALYQAGVQVKGAGSFVEEDVRGIQTHLEGGETFQEVLFFHSAGHVQQACLAGTLQPGDFALFNAASLLWQPPSFFGWLGMALGWGGGGRRRRDDNDGDNDDGEPHQLLPFAQFGEQETRTSTLQDFKDHYQLSLGLYCQEYDIDDAAIQLVAQCVNANSHVYDLGLCWGGRNGSTVDGLAKVDGLSDGFGSQRLLAQRWNASRYPPSRN